MNPRERSGKAAGQGERVTTSSSRTLDRQGGKGAQPPRTLLLLPPRKAERSPWLRHRKAPEALRGRRWGALAAPPGGAGEGGEKGRGGRGGAPSGAEALPVPGFRLRVPEEDPRPEGGAAARRDFQTRTMASSWWRWRHGCSWRRAARTPGPGSPGLTGPPGPHPAAAVRAQVRPRSAPGRAQRSHPNDSGAQE